MKHGLIAAVLLALPGLLWAQKEKSQEELIQARDKKLAEEWLKKADWITDYDTALEAAKKSGKPIFAYFTVTFFH